MKSIQLVLTGFSFEPANQLCKHFIENSSNEYFAFSQSGFEVGKDETIFHLDVAFNPECLSESKFSKEMTERYNAGYKAGEALINLINDGRREYPAIEPVSTWKEKRLNTINQAMHFAVVNGNAFPEDYISERNDLIEYLKEYNKQKTTLEKLNKEMDSLKTESDNRSHRKPPLCPLQ